MGRRRASPALWLAHIAQDPADDKRHDRDPFMTARIIQKRYPRSFGYDQIFQMLF
jgi:hypothetical protein